MRNNALSFAISCTMIFSSYFVVPAFATETTLQDTINENYIGTNPGLNFYSMIDDGTAKMIDNITKRAIQDRGTYGGLIRSYPCGKEIPWISSLPIDENLLKEISIGTYSRLVMLANSRGIHLTSESVSVIGTCLSDAYKALKTTAANDQTMLEQVGNMGLYMDGDTSNSDYDIIADIDKINAILFTETEKYKGVTNTAKSSFASFLAGNPVPSLFAGTGAQAPIDASGSIASTTETGATTTGLSNTGTTTTPSASISFGDMCSSGATQGITSVDNMVDSAFMSQLASAMSSGNGTDTNIGADYGNTAYSSLNNGSGGANTPPATSAGDFFNEIPCHDILCIKVRMVNGAQNLLGGSQNNSIETIIDRHIKIMGPIADSNLAGQKMTNNMYQLSWSNLKFSNIIPKPLIFLASKPQQARTDKNNDTPASKDAKLQASFQCAMYSAGLSSNLNVANSMIGGSYGVTSASTSANVGNTQKALGPTESEQKALGACLDVALSEGRKSYYDSFSTDITEIGAFTAGIIEEINGIIEAGKTIDALPVK